MVTVMAYNSTVSYLNLVRQLADARYHVPDHIKSSFMGYAKSVYQSDLENKYSEPMVWIGVYIALASLCCILAMMADLLHGLRSRKLWIPCKYFTINAASLTVIAVAMKLPVDLTGPMPGVVDQLAKLGSMALMCTMMANLLPSLATLDSDALLANVTALGVLVITLVVNVCIQIQTGVVESNGGEATKLLQMISTGDYVPKNFMFSNKVTSSTIAIIYSSLLLLLFIMHVCSSIAVVKANQIIELECGRQSYRTPRSVERLERHMKNYWIMAQSGNPQYIIPCSVTTTASGDGVVVICKIITFLPFFFVVCVLYCFRCCKWLLQLVFNSSGESTVNREQSLYVLQLEGEMELYERTLGPISESWNQLIQKSEKKKPENLMKLINKKTAVGFQGVKTFANNNDSQKCWSLAVVTLTTIAITLPDTDKKEVDSLYKSVWEGLEYVTLVEKFLNATNEYVSIRTAAERLWQEIVLCHKWLGIRLKDISSQVNTTTSQDETKQIVQLFLEKAKNQINKEMKSRDHESLFAFICAKSMSSVTETIIGDKESHNRLFDELSLRITDIMEACLTNLPQVIAMNCHASGIEKREASVQSAAKLLGETKQIINTLQDRALPSMNPDDLPFIDKWRDYLCAP